MNKKILSATFGIIFLLIYSCAPSELTINYLVDPKISNEKISTIALMPLIDNYLTDEERMDIDERFFDLLENNYRVLDTEQSIELLKQNDLLEDWKIFWNNYLTNQHIDKNLLLTIGKRIKIDAIVQGNVLDISKQLPVHRKIIGETSAKLKYSIFSTTSGKLLWEANSFSKQINAHTDQATPMAMEALDIALDEIMDNFPYR
ncbi:MAG: hypothetical protein A2V66_00540 [Ignavibacteria bacterium RBG_13_36_8]|nr:MAG: hypothetical protein A2V66_00540 [Ignavibacteria bacterium RBG_13_36_8]